MCEDTKGLVSERKTFPFSDSETGICVSVMIANTPYSAIFDTGSAFTVVDPVVRPLLGDKLGHTRLVSGPVKIHADGFECPEIRIGPLALPFIIEDEPAVAFVCDFQGLRNTTHEETHVVVGIKHLGRMRIEVDFDHRRLTMLEEADKIHGERVTLMMSKRGVADTLGLIGYDDGIRIGAIHNGNVEHNEKADFLIDTGISDTIGLDNALYDTLIEHGLIRPIGKVASSNIEGKLCLAELGRLRKCSIGNFELENLTVLKLGGNVIGTRLLSRFVVTFDLPNDAVFFRPGKRFRETDLTGIQGFGVYFRRKNKIELRNNALTVVIVDPNGPAEIAGLKVDDVIERIAGNTFGNRSFFEINRSFEKPGQDLQLRIRRGEETHDITIAVPKEPPGMFAFDDAPATNKKAK